MPHWIDELQRNTVFAWRLLRQRPTFSVLAILTLGLCIGVNTAVFTLVDTVLFRAAPYPEPERLADVVLHYRMPGREGTNVAQNGEVWEAVRDHARAIDRAVYSSSTSGLYLAADDRVQHVERQRVGSGYFRVLGLELLHGRGFSSEEDRPGGPAVALLSEGLWRRAFGGDSSIVGRTVTLGGESHTVVGIAAAPPSSTGVDLWTPLRASTRGEGGGSNYRIVARLADDRTWEEAETELAAIGQDVVGRPDREDVEVRLGLAPIGSDLKRGLSPLLFVLWATVATVLLIGATNLATMLMARGDERTREMATRVALGGGRGAVVRQLQTESLVLALLGGAVALGLAALLLAAAEPIFRETLGIRLELHLDRRALFATSLLAVGTAVLVGTYPALRASRLDVRRGLAVGTGSAASARSWPRRLAVVGQVALCVTLLVGAGLLVQSARHLQRLDPGFDVDDVVTARVALRDARYTSAETVHRFFERAVQEVETVPGVEAAAVGLSLPFERGLNMPFRRLDEEDGQDLSLTTLVYVTPDYFEALRIPLLRGRSFDHRDRADSAPVAVVNREFARRYLEDGQALGTQLEVQYLSETSVVGVVGDVQQRPGWGDGSVGPLAPMPTVYVPATQVDDELLELVHTWFSPAWIVRSQVAASTLTPRLQDAVRSVDPLLPLIDFRTMDAVRAESIGLQRLQGRLLGGFAALALLLAAVGIYGVMSSVVTARRRELGIRMALGATRAGAVRRVFGDGLRLIVVGLALGLPMALLGARALRGLVFGIGVSDPVVLGSAIALLLSVGALAASVPAWRAARIHPAETLRSE